MYCDKCHKYIERRDPFGYSHPCGGRIKEINEIAEKRRQSIDLMQSRDRYLHETKRIQTELAYANIVYTPSKIGQLQGEVWTRKAL